MCIEDLKKLGSLGLVPILKNENYNKFTLLIMQKIDKKIEAVSVSSSNGPSINKLDNRGGHLEARKNLIYTLNTLPDSSVVKNFILKHIDIPFELSAKFEENNLITNFLSNESFWLKIEHSKYKNLTAGTYMFFQNKDSSLYIGSTINFKERLLAHKNKFLSKSKNWTGYLHRSQADQLETLQFSIIHKIPNLLDLFILENPNYKLLQGEGVLLSLLTFYPVRVLEQNLIDKLKPSINGGKLNNVIVSHSFTLCDPMAFSKPFLGSTVKGKSVNIYDEEFNLLWKAPSKQAAMRYMGIPTRTNIDNNIGNLRGKKIVNASGFETKYLLNYEGGNWIDRSIVKIKKEINFKLPDRELNSLNKVYIYLFNYPELSTFLVFTDLKSTYEFLFPIQAKLHKTSVKDNLRKHAKKVNAVY